MAAKTKSTVSEVPMPQRQFNFLCFFFLLVASGEFVSLEHCVAVVPNEDPREPSEPTADDLAHKPRRDEELRHPEVQQQQRQCGLHHGRFHMHNHWEQHDHRHVAVDAREAIRVWVSVLVLIQGIVEVNGPSDLRHVLQQQHAQQVAHADPHVRQPKVPNHDDEDQPIHMRALAHTRHRSASYRAAWDYANHSTSDMSCVR